MSATKVTCPKEGCRAEIVDKWEEETEIEGADVPFTEPYGTCKLGHTMPYPTADDKLSG
jgi:hypothetical protein